MTSDATNSIGSQLLARYLSDPKLSFSSYRALAQWLGCYEMRAVAINEQPDPIDKQLLAVLVQLPQLNFQQILDKILFIRGLPAAYKQAAIGILKGQNNDET